MTNKGSKIANFLLISGLLGATVCGARSKDRVSLSANEISEAALLQSRTVGGTIVEVRSVLPDIGQPGGLVFETLNEKQWRISFVRSDGGKVRVAWVSEPFGSPFEEAVNNRSLDVISLMGETLVQFRGCAEHMCPDVFGITLLRLSDGESFTARVNRINNRPVEYSQNLLLPEYKTYKDWLDEASRK
jgi:hypothetical protein